MYMVEEDNSLITFVTIGKGVQKGNTTKVKTKMPQEMSLIGTIMLAKKPKKTRSIVSLIRLDVAVTIVLQMQKSANSSMEVSKIFLFIF